MAARPRTRRRGQKDPTPPVVGVGASAGGVQALQTFFESLPPDLGLAYVVILHLAPDRESELGRILALRTKMPVTVVDRPMPLEADHVYVIPRIGPFRFRASRSPRSRSRTWPAAARRSTSSSARWRRSTATASR